MHGGSQQFLKILMSRSKLETSAAPRESLLCLKHNYTHTFHFCSLDGAFKDQTNVLAHLLQITYTLNYTIVFEFFNVFFLPSRQPLISGCMNINLQKT